MWCIHLLTWNQIWAYPSIISLISVRFRLPDYHSWLPKNIDSWQIYLACVFLAEWSVMYQIIIASSTILFSLYRECQIPCNSLPKKGPPMFLGLATISSSWMSWYHYFSHGFVQNKSLKRRHRSWNFQQNTEPISTSVSTYKHFSPSKGFRNWIAKL